MDESFLVLLDCVFIVLSGTSSTSPSLTFGDILTYTFEIYFNELFSSVLGSLSDTVYDSPFTNFLLFFSPFYLPFALSYEQFFSLEKVA